MSYSEINDSQCPALQLLQQLGWKYISPEDTVRERGGIMSHVLLEGILEERLHAINSFEYKGNTYKFSQGNVQAAIYALKNIQDAGLVSTSEKAFDLLTLGKSFEETIQGDRKSQTMRYVDWTTPKNNVYHVTEEYEVSGLRDNRRPDLVLFINGIPFAVIENKRRDKNGSTDEAISQHMRNQGKEEGIPKLYHYAQLLVAMQPNEVKYATTGTAAKFWAVWKEANIDDEVAALTGDRMPTEQDRMLYCLCRPERVQEFAHQYILYDANKKKICRYQQYFAVRSTLERVKNMTPEGKRKGGVIWHTQGSGKSLTMVMLAKALALDKEITHARIIIVTDRIDLDEQIKKTFEACQKLPEQAKSGNHLAELIMDNSVEVITTIIDKFDSALSRKDFKNESASIFVLVDESHRSHYGRTHTKMRRVLPNASYLGFTGTPLIKADKSTADKFGGFIHTYTIEQAVKDKTVVPLLYEGRSAILTVNQKQVDKGFDRLAEPLTEYQARDLKRKFASITEVYKGQQVVDEIAHNISEHYCKNWKGKGFKAMLAVPLRETAIKYQRYFEQQIDPKLVVNTKVIISSPDTREGHEEADEEPNDEVQKWWNKNVKDYPGGAERYEESVITKFKDDQDDEVELLIVVGKLLTGFDSPNCTILYIAKPLAEHNLLQAIARVNRLFEGKDFGYIIDYVGLLGELDKALTDYAVLSEYEETDLKDALINVAQEIKTLPQRHADVVHVFKGVKNQRDKEALEQLLAAKDKRDIFIEKLTAFGRTLQTSMSSEEVYKIFNDERIEYFLSEFKFYNSLRKSVQYRYAEKIDYKEYEKRVRKLLDTYIEAEGVEQITEQVNIFNEELFKKEVERVTGSVASKADAIAHQMKKEIALRMDEDPILYKKFSKLIDEAIEEFRMKRWSEKKYLEEVIKVRGDLVNGNADELPAVLRGKPEARAYYGIVHETLKNTLNGNKDCNNRIAEAGVAIDQILSSLTIRDWKQNDDVSKKMENDIEDYLLERSKEWNIAISYEQLDKILDEIIQVAQKVY